MRSRPTGMRRRALLTAAGSAAIVAGCARATGSAAGPGKPSAAASASAGRTRAAVTVRLVGGFMAPGPVVIRPYRLAVYPDGLAIADATYQSRLPAADLHGLVSGLVHDLGSAP